MGSAFDEYDKENGYLDDEEIFNNNKSKYTNMLFYIYRTAMDAGATFNEMEETDICAYIDYLMFCIDNPKEEGEVN